MMGLLDKCKKNNKLLTSIVFLALLSITNNLEGYILSEFGFSYILLGAEFLSLVLTVMFLHFLICMIDEGRCTTVKKVNE
jgi:hypothetical protein